MRVFCCKTKKDGSNIGNIGITNLALYGTKRVLPFAIVGRRTDRERYGCAYLLDLLLVALVLVALAFRTVDLDVVVLNVVQDLLLHLRQFVLGERVRFRDQRNDVHLAGQSLHELHVGRLQAVADWRDEVEAAVNARVGDVLAVQAGFVVEKLVELLIDVVDDRTETGVVVDRVVRQLTDRQFQLDAALLDVHRVRGDLHRLVGALLHTGYLAVLVQRRAEQRIDQRGLAQSRFAWKRMSSNFSLNSVEFG